MASLKLHFSCQSTSRSSPPSLNQKLSFSSTSQPPHISIHGQSQVDSPIRSSSTALPQSPGTMSPRCLSKTFGIQSQFPFRKRQIRCLNTFLPYPEFDRSVVCLDNRRLGKQRVEAWQILRIVRASPVAVPGEAWANSPAVRMWRGFPDALSVYYNLCLLEWDKRGFKNVILQPVVTDSPADVMLPPWLGKSTLHQHIVWKIPRNESSFMGQALMVYANLWI